MTTKISLHESERWTRQRLGEFFEIARRARGLTVRALAKRMRTSPSQVQRILGKSLAGSVTLRTIAAAAKVLDVEVTLTISKSNR